MEEFWMKSLDQGGGCALIMIFHVPRTLHWVNFVTHLFKVHFLIDFVHTSD
jgi:hypothetical protein